MTHPFTAALDRYGEALDRERKAEYDLRQKRGTKRAYDAARQNTIQALEALQAEPVPARQRGGQVS